MKPTAAKILMALIILTRSSAFLFSKFIMEELTPFQALGYRFTLAFLVMALVLHRPLVRAWDEHRSLGRKSLLLGSCCLPSWDAKCAACLRRKSIPWPSWKTCPWPGAPVPGPVYRRLPGDRILQGVGFILLGVAALTIGTAGFTLAGGEGWALLAAVFYAGYIIAIGKLSHSADPLALGTLQMGIMGFMSFGAALVLDGGDPGAPGGSYLAVPCLPGAGVQLLRFCLPAQGPAVSDPGRSGSLLCHQSSVCQPPGTGSWERPSARRDPGSGVYPHRAGVCELEGSVAKATDLSAVSCQRGNGQRKPAPLAFKHQKKRGCLRQPLFFLFHISQPQVRKAAEKKIPVMSPSQ